MAAQRYCDFDSKLVTPRQRSVRINGLATCIRLEEIYWTIIDMLAKQESITVGKLLSKWAIEIDLRSDVVRNFTGYVRVICIVQLVRRIKSIANEDIDSLYKQN